MAFDDLTDVQRKMVVALVEELASGTFAQEFYAVSEYERGWHFKLFARGDYKAIGGWVDESPDEIMGVFGETDLYALADEDYITLIPDRNRIIGNAYAISLKPKAHQQYKLLSEPEAKKPWEIIPNPHQQLLVKSWHEGYIVKEIKEHVIDMPEQTIYNTLTKLRKEYGEDVVPKRR